VFKNGDLLACGPFPGLGAQGLRFSPDPGAPDLLVVKDRNHVSGFDYVTFAHSNFQNSTLVLQATVESSPSMRH